MANNIVAIIPARYDSTRLPKKLLLDIAGKSILKRAFEQVQKCKLIDRIIIATDHEDIYQHAKDFGAEIFLSKILHESGTDRTAELAALILDAKYIINIQGDEPFIDPASIDLLVNTLIHKNADIASLVISMQGLEGIENPNWVKVITDYKDQALYFSRSAIPFWRDKADSSIAFNWNKHIGIYGFKHQILLELAKLKPVHLERTEKLEQLRWLYYGYSIQMAHIEKHAMGIDTEQDYKDAIQYALANGL